MEKETIIMFCVAMLVASVTYYVGFSIVLSDPNMFNTTPAVEYFKQVDLTCNSCLNNESVGGYCNTTLSRTDLYCQKIQYNQCNKQCTVVLEN